MLLVTSSLVVTLVAVALPLRPSATPSRMPQPSLFLDRIFQRGPFQSAAAAEKALLANPSLQNFAALEAADPAPSDLLLRPELAVRVQGRWLLTTSIAAKVGEGVESESSVAGAVNASGLVIDTSAARIPVQEIDVARQRIGNEILFEVFGQRCMVRVAGSFKADAANGRRAVVIFDSLDVFSLEPRRRILRAGWLFALVRSLQPAALNGNDQSSWLETTYISPNVRLGRGNKGSIFVLERQPGEGPLDEWPL